MPNKTPISALSVYSKFSFINFSIIWVIIIVFLSEWMQKVGLIMLPLGFRHIIIVIFFVFNWIFFGRSIRLNYYYALAVFLIILYLIISLVFVPVPLLNYFLGICFTFLFLFVFILSANTPTRVQNMTKFLKWLLAFFIIMSLGPIIKGILGGTTLRSIPPGLFRELGAFGSSMNIGVIISLSLYFITGEKKYIYFSLLLSFGVLLTILKKSIISNIIVWIAFGYYLGPSKMRTKLVLYGIVFIFLSFSLVGDKIAENIQENIEYSKKVTPESHVRLGMYIAGYRIAKDYFPFGSGMGTFGSLASITGSYSHIYYDYGVSSIASNSQQHVASGTYTLLDTYWPHILAELGFIGAMTFLFIWSYPMISTWRIVRYTNQPIIRGLGFYIIAIVITMTNEGFTLYTPEIPSFVIIHSGIVGLCYYHIRRFQNNPAEYTN